MSVNLPEKKQEIDKDIQPTSDKDGFVNNVLNTYNKQNKQVKLAIIGMIISLLVPFISGGFSVITTLIEASSSSKSQATPMVIYVTPQATSNPISSPTPATIAANSPSGTASQQSLPIFSGLQITYFQTSIFLALLVLLIFFFIGASVFLKKPINILGMGIYFILTVSLILYLYFAKKLMVWGIVTLFLAGYMYITLYELSRNWDVFSNGRASNSIGFFTLYGLFVGLAIIYAGWLQTSYLEYVPTTLIIGYPICMFAISRA